MHQTWTLSIHPPPTPLPQPCSWFAPSNIGVPALGGKSLFGLFSESIGQELSHFPVGPALTDNFWLYLVTWHVGLFLTLFLGQIGVRGRAQGYFD